MSTKSISGAQFSNTLHGLSDFLNAQLDFHQRHSVGNYSIWHWYYSQLRDSMGMVADELGLIGMGWVK